MIKKIEWKRGKIKEKHKKERNKHCLFVLIFFFDLSLFIMTFPSVYFSAFPICRNLHISFSSRKIQCLSFWDVHYIITTKPIYPPTESLYARFINALNSQLSKMRALMQLGWFGDRSPDQRIAHTYKDPVRGHTNHMERHYT